MSEWPSTTVMLLILHGLVQIGLIVRVLLRPHREPSSRIAWTVVVIAFPVLGILSYVLVGETNVGRDHRERVNEVLAQLHSVVRSAGMDQTDPSVEVPESCAHLFQVGRSVNGLGPVGGNRGRLMRDSIETIDCLVEDIDSAREHVHLLFYIWLPDRSGCRVAEALKRAAARGVTCRAMADSLGSRLMIASKHWRDMREAGVHLASALPFRNPLLRPLRGRVDLRNHRKIVVIDGRITFCGSQNCADPEFRIKAKYAPWVDAVMRFEGPIARQNQFLFAGDWMAAVDEDISHLLMQPPEPLQPGFPAQVIGTGPTIRNSAMPEVFEALMYAARRELVITTPYYVPDEPMQAALCASARRGVDTILILPARNDSWVVAAASRSYYSELLAAGVRIFEYQGGLLHTKSLTLDGEVTLIGSANMDRRSFELNYENNILLFDPPLTADMRQRQQSYIAQSMTISREMVECWGMYRQLWNNSVAMFGPVL
ncbi:cardiolipin synthase [Candidatus Sumerlaeota bacterium]|nr:cardiolipin synthase [Candidatus Sumerlaeota bacterium]